MTSPSFTLVLFAVLLVAVLGIFLVRLSHRKSLQRRQTRKALLQRVESLPLPRLLHALGISFTRYFYTVPLETIHESIEMCEDCPSVYRCEQRLACSELDPGDMDFCPVKRQIHQPGRVKH